MNRGTAISRTVALTLIALTWGCHPVSALIGYDCETPSVNITTIAIDKVAGCSPEPNNYQVTALRVQVLQREDIREQWVRTCLVEVVRTIHHCGMHSHSSMVAGGITSYIHTLGASECTETHRQKTLTIHGKHVTGLKINGTMATNVVMFGHVDATGYCNGVTFIENDRTWNAVVVQAAVKITLTEAMAKLKLSVNEITIPGGVVCPFLLGHCTDSTYGDTVWDVTPTRLCDNMVTLYEGDAKTEKDQVRDMTYLIVEEGDRIFALTLLMPGPVCGRKGWQTEHPEILTLNVTSERPVGDIRTITSPNVDLLMYLNSKFLYVEQASKRQLEHLYTDTIYRRCLMHREILKNRLLTAPLSPSAVGWLIKQQQGFVGRVLGEVLYLLQCTPRPAILRRSDRCYNELPVSVNNQSCFLSPTTHIIQTHAEEVDCSPLTPPMFFISNQWVGLMPEPVVRESPVILEPEEEERLHFGPIQPISGGGLYTNEEVTRSQKLILFGTVRKAVENLLVRKITGGQTDNQGLHSIRLFDEEELRNLAQSTMKQIWGWFTDFGVFISGLMGIYVVLQIIKYVVSITINSWQIYRTLVCGLAVLAALWDTLTMWVLHNHFTKDNEKAEEGPKEVIIERPSAPSYNEVVSWPPSTRQPPRHWSEEDLTM